MCIPKGPLFPSRAVSTFEDAVDQRASSGRLPDGQSAWRAIRFSYPEIEAQRVDGSGSAFEQIIPLHAPREDLLRGRASTNANDGFTSTDKGVRGSACSCSSRRRKGCDFRLRLEGS